MVEMNYKFYVSLVVHKVKVFVGSRNFQLNNCISVSLYNFFLVRYIINFLFNFFGINQYWICTYFL